MTIELKTVFFASSTDFSALLGTATGDISNDFIYNTFGLVYDKIDVTFTAVQKGETVEFAFETKTNGNDQGSYVLLCCSNGLCAV